MLPVHECYLADLVENGCVGQVKIAHVVVAIEDLFVEHLREEGLFGCQFLSAQFLRVDQVAIPVNPHIIEVEHANK